MSRWYNEARPGEVYRLMTLARESLRAEGITDVKRHLIVVKTRGRGQRGVAPDGVGTMLLSSTPFSDADIDAIDAAAERLGFVTVLSPRQDGDDIARQLLSEQDVSALLAGFPINITAPTDNSPFFFQMLRLRDIFKLDLLQAGKQSANMAAVFILGALLLTVAVLSSVCIVLPLVVGAGTKALARQRARSSATSPPSASGSCSSRPRRCSGSSSCWATPPTGSPSCCSRCCCPAAPAAT